MRLSTVFELLLIFLLIAFAAYGRVIDRDEVTLQRSIRSSEGQARQEDLGVSVMSVEDAAQNLNKYCNCDATVCNCCRNFSIPFVALGGPGCASLQYLKKDNLAVQVSFRDNILSSRVIDGKQPTPMCIPMPGGLSKLCARVYSIEQEPDNHFKACLMLELQSSSETEAAIRVRCFRFGPNGLEVHPAEALPVVEPTRKPSDDDDDDDDDVFGLDDDDDDDDDVDVPAKNTASPPNNSQTEEDDDDDDDDDILGFDALLDIITGDDDSEKKKKKEKTTTAASISFTIPMIKPSTVAPHKDETVTSTKQPVKDEVVTPTIPKEPEHAESSTAKLEDTSVTESSPQPHEETTIDSSLNDTENQVTERIEVAASSDVKVTIKPKKSLLNRITVGVPYKKINGASSSINAIQNDDKKPIDRPNKPDPTHEPLHADDVEDILADDDDDKELEELDEEDDAGTQVEDDDAEDEELLNDDDEEEEDEVISALISDDKEKQKVVNGGAASPKPEESDEDYATLSELLARRRSQRRGRQSKVMRL